MTTICESFTQPKIALEIMGDNFFGIAEAAEHFGINLSNEQIAALAKVPFTEEMLRSCKDTHILVAVFPISILYIRKLYGHFFYQPIDGWYDFEEFARREDVIGWQLVCKTPVENSASMYWDEQQALLRDDDEVPSARVMVYTIIGHFLARREQLFENTNVRVSCVDSGDEHVDVGFFASLTKLGIYCWHRGHYCILRLASAKKPIVIDS